MTMQPSIGADFTAELTWSDDGGAINATGSTISAELRRKLTGEKIIDLPDIVWTDGVQGGR